MRESVHLEGQHFTAQKEDRALRLILRTGRDPLVNRQVGQEIAEGVCGHAGTRAIPLGAVVEEPANPVRIASLRTVRVVASADSLAQQVECLERGRPPLGVDGPRRGRPAPVGALQKIDEVDAEGLLGLPHLPVLPPPLALERVAELSDLVAEAGGLARGAAGRTRPSGPRTASPLDASAVL